MIELKLLKKQGKSLATVEKEELPQTANYAQQCGVDEADLAQEPTLGHHHRANHCRLGCLSRSITSKPNYYKLLQRKKVSATLLVFRKQWSINRGMHGHVKFCV